MSLKLGPGYGATVKVRANWMGSDDKLDLTLRCRQLKRGSHYGVLSIEGAQSASGEDVPLPPSDGEILLEYVRVPEQANPFAGCDTMEMVGSWNERFRAVIWIHQGAEWDSGTDLPVEEYDVPPARFAPVVRALRWLELVWKLG